ncbi:MAG TPA: DUF1572 family protein [Chitinophagaceae bacterium]|jgi:Protein of unknown function (DUF1572)|nr:DUF1572 family protein [Chitinophagaceae bacterium]
MTKIFLQSAIKRLAYYKELGDKTFVQLQDADFHFMLNEASNSIAVIIQHLSGNMLSRWTNFLTEDGEKQWRSRDAEFEITKYSKEQLLGIWEKGWQCMFDALKALEDDDLLRTIYIRTEPLSVIDAINRQLAHYPYHVGQVVYLGRLIKNNGWQSLSIAKGESAAYNDGMKNR